MSRTIALLAATVLGVGALGACSSDDDTDDPVDEVPDSAGFDTDVGDGVDTNVEESENLQFDEPDEG